jgi:hypothetical protein
MYVNPRLYKINDNSIYVYLAHILAFFFFLIRKCKENYAKSLTFIKGQLGLQTIEFEVNDPIEEYIKKQKERLLRTWENESVNSKINTNIDAIFYNKKEFNNIIKIENNDIEKLWKSRILYETTPRGNIAMYYDAFKQGFAYYCEQNGIPYSILNAVAMKYVVVFFCRDFFMDERTIVSEEDLQKKHEEYVNIKISPLFKIYYTEENDSDSEKDQKSKKIESTKDLLKDAPFAKLKNYKIDTQNDTIDKNINQPPELKPLSKNKFISLGKIRDFNFIQKPPKHSCMSIVSTSFDGLFAVPSTPTTRQTTSYKDYKQKKVTYKDYKEGLQAK